MAERDEQAGRLLRGTGTSRGLRFLLHVALVGASVLGALALGEIATRVLLPPRRGVSWYHYDDRYAMRHRSNADSLTNDWGDHGVWRFRTNARGFRGADWPPAPPPGVRRVLVMGDSMTFGNGVEDEQAYPRVANRALGPPWEILNLGTSAWGPHNALAYLETEGSDLEASCLVYGFFVGNDVLDQEIAPLFELRDGALVRVEAEASRKDATARARGAARSIPLHDFLLEHSQLFNVLRDRAVRFLTRDDARRAEDRYATVDAAGLRAAMERSDATMHRLATLARHRFGGFAVLLVPTREQLAPAVTGTPAFPPWIADESRRHMLEWCGNEGVPCVDLTAELPREPTAARRLYFEQDFHLSVEGNRAAGEILARHVPALCGGAR